MAVQHARHSLSGIHDVQQGNKHQSPSAQWSCSCAQTQQPVLEHDLIVLLLTVSLHILNAEKKELWLFWTVSLPDFSEYCVSVIKQQRCCLAYFSAWLITQLTKYSSYWTTAVILMKKEKMTREGLFMKALKKRPEESWEIFIALITISLQGSALKIERIQFFFRFLMFSLLSICVFKGS